MVLAAPLEEITLWAPALEDRGVRQVRPPPPDYMVVVREGTDRMEAVMGHLGLFGPERLDPSHQQVQGTCKCILKASILIL